MREREARSQQPGTSPAAFERGYVEHRGNRYEMTAKLNVPNLQRHMRSNINIIKAAAKRLGTPHP